MAALIMLYSGLGFLGIAIIASGYKIIKDVQKENGKHKITKYIFKR